MLYNTDQLNKTLMNCFTITNLMNFRQFNLKESFWFALTSFTPQGGGEAPKALSGRTLVAAYWLFVVLMLATFTANLAAFLTVERMQVSLFCYVRSFMLNQQPKKINKHELNFHLLLSVITKHSLNYIRNIAI